LPPTKANISTGDGMPQGMPNGYYWITGRVDDVINVSGHRMGTAEVESSLVAHALVSEAAVVGYPHDIKGQGHLRLRHADGGHRAERGTAQGGWWRGVRKDIGPIASPDQIQFAPGLPKTRSGKIMRRILRKDRRGRTGKPRRHLDAGGPRRGRRFWCDIARTRRGQGLKRFRSPQEARFPGCCAATSARFTRVFDALCMRRGVCC